MNAQEILNFWFHELDSKQWFQSPEQLDNEIKQRFSKVWQAAAQGELAHWRTSLQGRLAEIIVLDQFSRNIFRNQNKRLHKTAWRWCWRKPRLNRQNLSN